MSSQEKTRLIERIDESRAALDQMIEQANEEQLTRRGPDGWSVKDHLAHLAAWEQSLLALLDGRPRHPQSVGAGHATIEDGTNVDAVNAVIHQRNRDRSLNEVLGEYHESHRQVLARLAMMSDADLQKPYSHYQPHDPPDNPDPVIRWVAGNTYEHYQEHLAVIRRLLDTAES